MAASGAMFNQILLLFWGWGTERVAVYIAHKIPLLLIGKTPKGMEEGTTKNILLVEHSQTNLLAKLQLLLGDCVL